MSSRRGKRRRRKSAGGNTPVTGNQTAQRDDQQQQPASGADDAFDAGVFERGRSDADAGDCTDADELHESEAVAEVRDNAPPHAADDADAADESAASLASESASAGEPGDDADAVLAIAAEEISALKTELASRDELVAALTAQLEDAADRLDRVRRAGVDRNPPPRPSAAWHESASQLEEQLARLADAWDHFESSAPFAALERKLDRLQALLGSSERTALPHRDLTEEDRAYMPTSSPADADVRGESLAGWEQMKAKILSGASESPEESTPALAAKPVDKFDEPPVDPPEAIDFDDADRLDLEEAILRRDDYISYLIRKYRASPAGRHDPINWQSLAGSPEDLRNRLEDLEARLQELLRMEECDLSLERARLARERARLEQLSRELKRTSDDDGAETEESRDERRWLRVFGFGRKTDEAVTGKTE